MMLAIEKAREAEAAGVSTDSSTSSSSSSTTTKATTNTDDDDFVADKTPTLPVHDIVPTMAYCPLLPQLHSERFWIVLADPSRQVKSDKKVLPLFIAASVCLNEKNNNNFLLDIVNKNRFAACVRIEEDARQSGRHRHGASQNHVSSDDETMRVRE